MKQTINYLGTFGMVVIPIAIGLLVLGAVFVANVISGNINLY